MRVSDKPYMTVLDITVLFILLISISINIHSLEIIMFDEIESVEIMQFGKESIVITDADSIKEFEEIVLSNSLRPPVLFSYDESEYVILINAASGEGYAIYYDLDSNEISNSYTGLKANTRFKDFVVR